MIFTHLFLNILVSYRGLCACFENCNFQLTKSEKQTSTKVTKFHNTCSCYYLMIKKQASYKDFSFLNLFQHFGLPLKTTIEYLSSVLNRKRHY